MNVQSFSDIYNRLKNRFIANQNKITDLNEGSIISTIFESTARVLEKEYIDVRNGYTNNLKAIAYSLFGFKAKEGQKATARVIFSRTNAIDKTTTIPVGTKVSSGSYIFITTNVGTIANNQVNSNEVIVQAENVGTEYNVKAETINIIISQVSDDVATVKNSNQASGGLNAETEDETLARFKMYINGLQGSNYYGIKSVLLELPDVRSVSIEEQFPPLDHIYNAVVYVDDGTGNLPDALKEEVMLKINGNDSSDEPGCRSAGLNYKVQAATIIPINISVNCSILRTDHTTADFDIENALQEEINNLGIGESVLLTNVILRLRRISYVKDVSNLTLNGSAANVVINTHSIARCNTINVTYTDL